jgi:putative peptide zinc metalloprotease protein
MMLCSIAVMIWTNTQPGEWIHEFCYKLILLTGIAVVVINLNPLIKLDGYYFFTEWLRVPDLKERSTTFLISWIQRKVFRLAVDVPVVSRRRVPLFVVYAVLSGAYSYLLLMLFVRFSYNVFFHWFAELALVPAAALAFVIFRSRLQGLKNFAMNFFRTRTGEGAFHLTPLRAVAGIVVLAVLFVPIMRDRFDAYFVIEPRDTHQVHAGVPGKILAVYVKEGDAVRKGQVMARLQSLNAASAGEEAAEQVASSQAQVFSAELRHTGLGPALVAQQAARGNSAIAREERAQLAVRAPADGVVATSDPGSLLNRDVTTGETLLRIVDPSQLVARLYIPVTEMDRIRVGDPVSLHLPSRFSKIQTWLGTIEGSTVPAPAGVLAEQEYKGIAVPTFYTSRMPLGELDEGMRPGMSGQAKIFGRRRSLASRMMTSLGNQFHTHFW